jgi:hypothetical protein
MQETDNTEAYLSEIAATLSEILNEITKLRKRVDHIEQDVQRIRRK